MNPIGPIALAGAAIFMLVIMTPNLAAYGQQAAPRPQSEPAPAEPAQIDPDALKVPHPAPLYDASKFDLGKSEISKSETGKSEKDKPDLAIPKGIDLGKSQLELDAKRTTDVTKPGLAKDSGETSNLSKVTPGQKQEPVLPDYFGLRITTPTH